MKGSDLRAILSRNIKFFRSHRGLSQAELAEKADISIAFLSNIERGNKWPYPDTLVHIARGLGVEVFELFKPENEVTATSETQEVLSRVIQDITHAFGHSMDAISNNYLEKKE
jgi:transcriptional regulator with XRE-family HTH domain